MIRLLLQLADLCKHLDALDRSGVARGSEGAMQFTCSTDPVSPAGDWIAPDASGDVPEMKLEPAIVELFEVAEPEHSRSHHNDYCC